MFRRRCSAMRHPRRSAGLCALGDTVPGLRCVATAECYDGRSVKAGVRRVTCDRPHAWEVFAFDEPPADVTYPALLADPRVRAACGPATLVLLVPSDFSVL